MKLLTWIKAGVVFAGLAFLVGCGSSSDNKNNGSSAAVSPYSCQAGYLYSYTYGGCYPQCGTAGNVLVNGQCMNAGAQGAASCQGSCAAGQIQTQWGCYPQATNCGTCGALVNNQCIQGVGTSYGYGTGYGYGYQQQYGYPYGYGYGYPNYGYGGYRQYGPFYLQYGYGY